MSRQPRRLSAVPVADGQLPFPQFVDGSFEGTRTSRTQKNRRAAAPDDRHDIQRLVLAFHKAFELPREPLPTLHQPSWLHELRLSLVQEEVDELIAAVRTHDLTAVADALGDITYAVYGTAITYGIDLDRVLLEIHRSNMSKLDYDDKPLKRFDGKVLKSGRYTRPELGSVLATQLPLFHGDVAESA